METPAQDIERGQIKRLEERRDAGTDLQSVRMLSARLFMNSSYLSSKSPFLPKKKEVK